MLHPRVHPAVSHSPFEQEEDVLGQAGRVVPTEAVLAQQPLEEVAHGPLVLAHDLETGVVAAIVSTPAAWIPRR